MSFLIKYNQLLKKIQKIWDEISKGMETEFDTEPVYDKKYLKTKAKSHGGTINTDFHGNLIPKQGFYCVFLSMI